MKKLISIVLSLVMLISVGVLSSVPAFAIVGSNQSTTTPAVIHNKIIPEVNGNNTNDIVWEWVSDNPKQIKFTYTGDGTLTGWDFGTLKEGVDYKIIAQDGNTITIELLNSNFDGDIVANAKVEEEEEEEEEEETTKASTVVTRDGGSTSPKTGAAAAAGIAVMGAGVAILTALKKKED